MIWWILTYVYPCEAITTIKPMKMSIIIFEDINNVKFWWSSYPQGYLALVGHISCLLSEHIFSNLLSLNRTKGWAEFRLLTFSIFEEHLHGTEVGLWIYKLTGMKSSACLWWLSNPTKPHSSLPDAPPSLEKEQWMGLFLHPVCYFFFQPHHFIDNLGTNKA